jgi:hypothetical protein
MRRARTRVSSSTAPNAGTSGVLRELLSRETMTIQIPDDLARGLEGIAAVQQKSIEQLALESLRSLFGQASSPEMILRSVRELPHPSVEAVDDVDAAIAAGRVIHPPRRMGQQAVAIKAQSADSSGLSVLLRLRRRMASGAPDQRRAYSTGLAVRCVQPSEG